MFTPGLLVTDRYRLDAPIAAGGMGQVWRATDTVLGRTVAVKLLDRLVDDTTQARFRNEARAMAALQHPGVADVYDYGETDLPGGTQSAYIVMACVEGQPLSRRIAAGGGLDAAQTRSIVAQAARALQAVHDAGVVHRDVKPGNLIIESDGTVVLIDFGVAVTADTPGQTKADEVVGTALYMAPEQVAKQTISPATDVYALGAVAYHCLAGRPPFDGDNAVAVALNHLQDEPPPLPDDIPADLRHVVMTAMAKDPARRYPTADAMADAVQNEDAATVVLGAANAAQPMTEPQPHAPPTRSRHRGVGLVLAGLVAVLAVLVLADPLGVLPLPGDRPRPPAATTDPSPGANPAGDDPSGGAGGNPQSTSATETSPGPAGQAPAGGAAPDTTTPPPDGEEPAGPTSSAEPPEAEPSTPDDIATEPPDPEPTEPNGEASPEPATSPAGFESA